MDVLWRDHDVDLGPIGVDEPLTHDGDDLVPAEAAEDMGYRAGWLGQVDEQLDRQVRVRNDRLRAEAADEFLAVAGVRRSRQRQGHAPLADKRWRALHCQSSVDKIHLVRNHPAMGFEIRRRVRLSP
jgi:hypothetical protein